MSYTPTTWESGDVITAEKLNKLENGVAGAGGDDSRFMIVNATTTDMQTLTSVDKTASEVTSFISSGGIPIMRLVNNNPDAPYEAAYYLMPDYMELTNDGAGFTRVIVQMNPSSVNIRRIAVYMPISGSASISDTTKTVT